MSSVAQQQKDWQASYPIAVLDRAVLQCFLSATEVAGLTDEDMKEIAAIMQDELRELGFWEYVAFIARCKLTEKGGGNSKEPMQQAPFA
jgi:hypothetical protein